MLDSVVLEAAKSDEPFHSIRADFDSSFPMVSASYSSIPTVLSVSAPSVSATPAQGPFEPILDTSGALNTATLQDLDNRSSGIPSPAVAARPMQPPSLYPHLSHNSTLHSFNSSAPETASHKPANGMISPIDQEATHTIDLDSLPRMNTAIHDPKHPKKPRAAATKDSPLVQHLLSLATTVGIGYTCDHGLSAIHPASPIRLTPLSEELKSALCAYATHYSNHPALFPCLSGPSPRPPTFSERVKAAKTRFHHQPLIALCREPEKFTSMSQVYDAIRALHIRAYLSFGDMAQDPPTLTCFELAFSLVKQFQLLHPSTFSNLYPTTPSLDEMARLSPGVEISAQPNELEHFERAERLSILALVLRTDSVMSIATRDRFFFEEWEFCDAQVDLVDPSAQNAVDGTAKLEEKVLRDCRASIWQDTGLDSVSRQIVLALLKPLPIDSCLQSQLTFHQMKLFRKVVVLSRKQKYVVVMKGLGGEQLDLHRDTLKMMERFKEYSLITDLRPFLWQEQAGPDGKHYSRPASITLPHHTWYIQNTLQFLQQLIMLHFATCSYSENKFALTADGQALYTSREVLFACMNAFTWLMVSIGKPLENDKGKETVGELGEAKATGRLTSPYLVDLSFGLVDVHVNCSAILSCFHAHFSKAPQTFAVFDMVKEEILPVMKSLGGVWPGAVLLLAKLEIMVRQVSGLDLSAFNFSSTQEFFAFLMKIATTQQGVTKEKTDSFASRFPSRPADVVGQSQSDKPSVLCDAMDVDAATPLAR
ncbi:hypothetical protein HDU91_005358 [Kappamyces sp. JEL0680]|nr:hypothetical protein HDU91_005358 [Kappamyces sp. JEL0680]